MGKIAQLEKLTIRIICVGFVHLGKASTSRLRLYFQGPFLWFVTRQVPPDTQSTEARLRRLSILP